ncbi:multi-sensor signal transduction multi-kinase [Candidatus Magnetomorum sp. HK-1]|nr:multi-sensor signal transduction multi-kinase [Candidatus Magnetomorum sp. HK-1]
MIDISDFRVVETVYESDQTIIQRALNTHNDMPVVLKCAKRASLTLFKRVCYLHEFNTASALQMACVVSPIDFMDTPDGLVIIYQDTDCISLGKAITSRLYQTDEKIRLFYQTADALAQIHSQRWIHMHLSLDHILFDSKNNHIYLIDWQSSVQMNGLTVLPPRYPRETLETIPPELTGYTNFPVDERSDLYSLGCIFYEIFTHSPPFRENDSLQLIQAHVTQQSVPANEGYDPFVPVAQHVPESISHILTKLLSKNPADRYDSAQTLKSEILKCINDKSYFKTINTSKQSSSENNFVHMNEKLYDREKEIETIHSIYESFCTQQTVYGEYKNDVSNYKSTFLIVSGDTGTGKTTLCKTIIPSVWESKGFWIWDTFSCTPDLPLSIFGRILSYFLYQMRLKQADELENQIKQLVYKGLTCPPFLLELIPELLPLKDCLFSTSNPSTSETMSAEPFILSLFKIIFQNFQSVVLCLENLHWADTESLNILEKLLVHSDCSFFIIGTCHKKLPDTIQRLVKNCEKQLVNVYHVSIDNLSKAASHKFISEMFKCSQEQAETVGDIIYEQTRGNLRAFYTLLEHLFVNSLFVLEAINNHQNNLNLHETVIDQKSISFDADNILINFNVLTKSEIKFLHIASCIGPTWKADMICQIMGQTLSRIEPILQKIFQYGLIRPALLHRDSSRTNQEEVLWMFSNDTIQQKLYQMMPLHEQQYYHKQVSQQLASTDIQKFSNQSIYLAIRHCSLTEYSDLSKEQIIHLARMCMSAGERALMAGIFQSAYEFFSYGLSLFSEKDWKDHHQILFDLHLNSMVAANSSHMDQSLKNIKNDLIKYAKTDLQKLKTYECIARIYFRNNQFEEVREIVSQGLKDVGISFDFFSELFQRFQILKAALTYRRFQKINPGNKLSDKNLLHATIIRLIILFIQTDVFAPFSKRNPAVIALSINKMKKVHMTTDAAYLWVMFARYLIEIKGFRKISEHWARMGIAMIDRLTNSRLQTETRLIHYWYIDHRKKAAYTLLDHLKAEVNRCSLQGCSTLASRISEYYLILSIVCGKKLKPLLSDMHYFQSHIQPNSLDLTNDLNSMCRQTVLNLISGITPPHILIGQAFDEKKAIKYMESKNDTDGLFLLYCVKLMLSVLFRNEDKAIVIAEKLSHHPKTSSSTPVMPMFHFYSAIAYLGVCYSAKTSEKKVLKKKIQNHMRLLKRWSDQCPENALHRYYMVQAEFSNKFELKADIADCYDQAIALAKANHYNHEFAIINEFAGEYYMHKEKEKLARTYIEDAYQAYISWGADRKASEYLKQNKILQQHGSSQNIIWPDSNKDATIKSTQTQQTSTVPRVDKDDIWILSQSFCTELKLEKLVEKIIQTVLQHSGAHKGCLVLKKNTGWFVEAFLNLETQERYMMTSEPLENTKNLCVAIAKQVIQSRTTVCLWDAGKQGEFQYDEYIRENTPRSLLCLPVSHSEKISGLLYLENKRLTGLFTADRVKRMNIISSQTAIAIKNAQFFHTQECTVQDRATDLNLTVHQLSSAIQDLEARSREMMLLNQLSDELHGCNTEQGSYKVLLSFAKRLFPSDKGILWIVKDNFFSIATSWGNPFLEKNQLEISPCRCFESQNIIFVEDFSDSPRCQICSPDDDCIYLCIPLKDQSRGMGVLHFQFSMKRPLVFDDTFTRRLESRRMLVCRMIEHYALSLANLRLREALKYESIHDPLTGLFNRRHMQKTLNEEYEKAKQLNTPLGVVMIDIDHFKSFNDTYGHDIGDAVLKHLGSYLNDNMCDTLQACRYGGEEFLLMCPNQSIDELSKTAEKIRLGIMNDIKVPYKEKELDVTASLGTAIFPEHGQSISDILKKADDALYIAKDNGRNQVIMAN